MIFRSDKLLTALPLPRNPSANAAAAVQELMGGKAGEMSTLMNYFFQTINFRDRDNYRPYYDLVANIAAEEWGHVELVAAAINLILTGTTKREGGPDSAPLAAVRDYRNTYHFLAAGQNALPMDSMGNYWNGSYVHSSGNLKLDLVHNFFLELNARATKAKVYETSDCPTTRTLTSFLLVRGGTHIIAYAKALEELSGTNMLRLFAVPELSTNSFPEARQFVEHGLFNTMYNFTANGDMTQIAKIWKGKHPDGAADLVVSEKSIPTAAPLPVFAAEPSVGAPAAPEAEHLKEVAKRIFGRDVSQDK